MPRSVSAVTVFLMLACLLGAHAASAAEPSLVVPTRVTGATVFPDMALVVRGGTVIFDRAGPVRLELPGLPRGLRPDSFRVSGRGVAAKVTGTALEPAASSRETDEEIESLTRKLEGLNLRMRAFDEEAAAAAAERKFVESLVSTYAADQAKNMPQRRLDTTEWLKAGQFVRDRLAAIARQGREAEEKKRELTREIAEIQNRLAQLSSKRGMVTTTAHVDLEAQAAGSFTIEVRYLVPGARWSMAYDARIDSDRGEVSVDCRAQVTQQTGEDWSGVSLALSTARPSLDGSLPELDPRYIDFYQPPPPPPVAYGGARPSRQKMAVQTVADEGDADLAALSEAAPGVAAEEIEAGVETTGVVAFTAPRKADVPSDPRTHQILLVSRAWKAETSHEAAPELAAQAFLTARTTNQFDFPLPAGPVNLHIDGGYAGRASLPGVRPGEKMNLPFGIDDGIRVERKLINRVEGEEGVFSKSVTLRYSWLVTVGNSRKRPVKLRLSERVPASRQEELKVEIGKATTAGYDKDPDRPGVVVWNLELPAGATKEIRLEYTIEYPRGRKVTGLP